MIWDWVSAIVLAAVLIVAAVSDLRCGKVFNWLTYPAIVAGLALGLVRGASLGATREAFLDHLLGLALGFGVLFVAWLLGGMGGGDVKLMAAVGAILGWPAALDAVFYSFLVAAVIGLVLMIWRGETLAVMKRLLLAGRILPLPGASLDDALPEAAFRVPFGFAVCVGTLWCKAEDLMGRSLWDVGTELLGL